MFAEFWSEYGMTLIYTVLTAVLGFIGIAIKQILSKLSADKTKEPPFAREALAVSRQPAQAKILS